MQISEGAQTGLINDKILDQEGHAIFSQELTYMFLQELKTFEKYDSTLDF